MEKYNYFEAVLECVRTHIEFEENLEDYDSKEEFKEHLNEVLWVDDSVTGNASGSYTFSTWKAEENLCHNIDLLQEALEEFGCGIEYLSKGAEACDVTIRCYLLPIAIAEAVDVMEEDGRTPEKWEE